MYFENLFLELTFKCHFYLKIKSRKSKTLYSPQKHYFCFMKTTQALIPLFRQFIKESENGKRLKKNGERITKGSIDNYRYVLQNLIQFSSDTNFELRVCNIRKLTQKELISEKNYWKKFYKTFTEFMYKKGCFDNYVGANIKVIRVFFNYLQSDKDIFVGDFHKQFYVRKEEVDSLV